MDIDELRATLDASDRQLDQKVHHAVDAFQQETLLNQYRDQFVKDNPGYEEAFNKGELQVFIDQGMTGEEAWSRYQLNHTKAEVESLRKQIEELQSKGPETVQPSTGDSRLDRAVALARELQTRKQEQQRQAGAPMSRSEQIRRGVELVNRMKAGR
ncbi:MAG: hypothetical protein C4576_16035 [Desulfobacteraceae bacterium]|nr:MAG: hypothetical protein C4576_16035 [Desulfobacteraceae bacterium]